MLLRVPENQLIVPEFVPLSARSVEITCGSENEAHNLDIVSGMGSAAAIMCADIEIDDPLLVAVQERVIALQSVERCAELTLSELELLAGFVARGRGAKFLVDLDRNLSHGLTLTQQHYRGVSGQSATLQATLEVAGSYAWLTPPVARDNFKLFAAQPDHPDVQRGFTAPHA